jgi:hypothetical protein
MGCRLLFRTRFGRGGGRVIRYRGLPARPFDRGFSDCTVHGVQDEDLVELVDQVRHAAARGVVQERLRDLA